MNYKYFLLSEKFKDIFAITGGIGCGKSTALSFFENIGCFVIDSDKICHELYAKKDFTDILINKWDNLILTKGNIDRKKIANIVFNDNAELEWLNSIVHPKVFEYALEAIEKYPKRIVFFDIPLLFELKLEKFFKTTITVWTNKKTQYERLKARNNWSDKEINSRLNAQLSPDIKLEKAIYGIINTGNLNSLKIQCENIFLKIRN